MKYCNQCGHENPDDAKFCDGCGVHFEVEAGPPAVSPGVEQPPAAAPVAAPVAAPMPAAPAVSAAAPSPAPPAMPPVYAAPPVSPPAYAPPPAAPPTYAAPPAAPPTYVAPPAGPPVYGQPPAPPTAGWSSPGSKQWVKPAIIAAVIVAVVALGFFAYNSFLKPPMSVADYKAQLAKVSAELTNAGTQMGDLGTQMSSGDVTSRAAAKASWDQYAGAVRASMATVRGIKPPAEFQSQHDRIIKGLDQLERLLAAVDAVMRDLVSGAINNDNYQTVPSVVAVQTLTQDPAFSAGVSDVDAAIAEVQAK